MHGIAGPGLGRGGEGQSSPGLALNRYRETLHKMMVTPTYSLLRATRL